MNKKMILICAVAVFSASVSAQDQQMKKQDQKPVKQEIINPFYGDYSTPYRTVPFDKISIEDYNSSVDTKIKNIQDKTKEYEKQILDKLKNDSSYKNQLNLVNRMMYEFSKNK